MEKERISFQPYVFVLSIIVLCLTCVAWFSGETTNDKPNKFYEDSRLGDIARVSHLEHSVKILTYAHSIIVSGQVPDEQVVYLVNSEWNNVKRDLGLIFIQGSKDRENIMHFKKDPLNNLDKEDLKKCIEELEQKILFLHAYLAIKGSATEMLGGM
jgi:hypothetical protein